MSGRLLESLSTTEPLADAFSDASVLSAMLRFEVALARAEAKHGLIPHSATPDIEAAATHASFDPVAIARDARASATIAIPFIHALSARVREINPASATFVHWGATSQDVTDTALVLCLAKALPIAAADHLALDAALRRLSDEHADTVMLARTLLQPAPPITFGLKAAGWLAASKRSWAHVTAAFDAGLVLQFGGSSGTLSSIGLDGLAVQADIAAELNLTNPSAPWHSHRDRLASIVAACGIYTATLGKIARDVTLLMQAEVAEASEPGGGSSSMPHKRNPAGCAIAIAAANRVPGLVATFLMSSVQEHERGVGGGHAEAPTVAAIVQATGAALASMRSVIEHLSVNPGRMRANIAATSGVIFAERATLLLARRLGRDTANRLVGEALQSTTRGERTFMEALGQMGAVSNALTPAELSSLDAPETYIEASERMRQRLLHT